jgi:hypothetical protein
LLAWAFEHRTEPELPVQVQNILRCVGELWPGVAKGFVGVGDKGVDAVIAAVEGDEHQHSTARGQLPGDLLTGS